MRALRRGPLPCSRMARISEMYCCATSGLAGSCGGRGGSGDVGGTSGCWYARGGPAGTRARSCDRFNQFTRKAFQLLLRLAGLAAAHSYAARTSKATLMAG